MSTILLYAQTEAVAAAAKVAEWLRSRGYKAKAIDASLLRASEKERANAIFSTDQTFDAVATVYGADNVVAVEKYTDGNTLLAAGLKDVDPAGAPPAPPAPPPLPAPSSRRKLR